MKGKNDAVDQILSDISTYIESKDMSNMPAHLYDGKMGLCIYYFLMARYTGEDRHKERAECIIDEVYRECKKYTITDQLSFETGIAGIDFGITYLVRNEFMEADLDDILQEVDDFIFKRISIKTTAELSEDPHLLLGVAFYLIYTIKSRNDETSEFIQLRKELLVHIVNALDLFNNKSGYTPTVREPFLFDLSCYLLPKYLYIIGELYRLGLYEIKLDRIIEGLTHFVRGAYPVLQANRLYLLAAMYHLQEVRPLPEWEAHIQCLENSLDIRQMLHKEFRDKAITINNGLSGLLLLLNKIPEAKKFSFYKELKDELVEKICQSSYFTPIKPMDEMLGFVNGLSGVAVSLILNEYIKDHEA